MNLSKFIINNLLNGSNPFLEPKKIDKNLDNTLKRKKHVDFVQ